MRLLLLLKLSLVIIVVVVLTPIRTHQTSTWQHAHAAQKLAQIQNLVYSTEAHATNRHTHHRSVRASTCLHLTMKRVVRGSTHKTSCHDEEVPHKAQRLTHNIEARAQTHVHTFPWYVLLESLFKSSRFDDKAQRCTQHSAAQSGVHTDKHTSS